MKQKILLKAIQILVNTLSINKLYLFNNELVILINPQFLINIFLFLKLHVNYQYTTLTCISGVDY